MKTIKKEDNSKFLKILIYQKRKKRGEQFFLFLWSHLPSVSLFCSTTPKTIFFFSNVINIIFLETSVSFFDITTFLINFITKLFIFFLALKDNKRNKNVVIANQNVNVRNVTANAKHVNVNVSNGLKINVKNLKRKKEEIDETNKKKKDVDVQAPEEIHIMYVFF